MYCSYCRAPKREFIHLDPGTSIWFCKYEDEAGIYDEWKCPKCDRFNNVSRISCMVCNYCIAMEESIAYSGMYSRPPSQMILSEREEIIASKPVPKDSYIAFATFEPISSTSVSTKYIQYAKEEDIRAPEPKVSHSDFKYRTTGNCSCDCPRNCPNNRLYIHEFSHSIRRQDMEEWLERIGSLEIVTKSGKQHRHLVIWDNGKGTCDAVA